MNHRNTQEKRTTRRVVRGACATAIAIALSFSLEQAQAASEIVVPSVPSTIQLPPGQEAFLVGHAFGTQNYICVPSGAGFAWSLFTPEATLFNDSEKQITTHFFSPNPVEKGTIRATWESSRDTSTVWGQVNAASTDAAFVAPGAVAWLLVQVVGAREGPSGGDTLTPTKFIQRLNTVGGAMPATGCAVLGDVGQKAFVPYTADYFFFTDQANH